MEHLLLTRFQGALIGGNIIYINPAQIAPNQLMIDVAPVLMSGITRLTDPGRFDPQAWAKNTFIDIPSPDRLIVAMLPLMLFFHDDRTKLREILIDVSHAWQLDWETCSSAIAIGYIISRSLTESFNPSTIILQLLDEMSNLHPLLFQQLSTILGTVVPFSLGRGFANIERLPVSSGRLLPAQREHQLSSQSGSLHQIAQRLALTSHPIITPTVLAIYCLLSTPEDFGIATRRAYQLEDRSGFTCALTGMLAGAQNTLTGMPINGNLATQTRAQWLLAAENLLSAWAGVYHKHSFSSATALL
jgi:hypothetical protein